MDKEEVIPKAIIIPIDDNVQEDIVVDDDELDLEYLSTFLFLSYLSYYLIMKFYCKNYKNISNYIQKLNTITILKDKNNKYDNFLLSCCRRIINIIDNKKDDKEDDDENIKKILIDLNKIDEMVSIKSKQDCFKLNEDEKKIKILLDLFMKDLFKTSIFKNESYDNFLYEIDKIT